MKRILKTTPNMTVTANSTTQKGEYQPAFVVWEHRNDSCRKMSGLTVYNETADNNPDYYDVNAQPFTLSNAEELLDYYEVFGKNNTCELSMVPIGTLKHYSSANNEYTEFMLVIGNGRTVPKDTISILCSDPTKTSVTVALTDEVIINIDC